MDKYDAAETAYKNGYEAGYADGKRDAVKPGKWITDGFISKCSLCGARYMGVTIFASSELSYKYCPNCGASMDQEVKT